MMEADLIAWIRGRLPEHPRLRLGPGDDAAILAWANRPDCVVTTDLLADGVHFDLAEHAAARVGRKTLAVNLSDLAAMAARPHSAVVSLLLPRDGAHQLAVDLYEGLLPLAEEFYLPIAGGDVNTWDGPLVVSVTLLGQLTDRGPLLRGGARVGDQILVTGSLGGSMLGHHLDFTPRIEEALELHRHYRLHAGMDISDGLALDLSRMTTESGCGAELDVGAIPIADAAWEMAGAADTETALRHALSDGEDFELLLAVPPGEAQRLLSEQPIDVPVSCIGHFVDRPGLWRTDDRGDLVPLAATGYQH